MKLIRDVDSLSGLIVRMWQVMASPVVGFKAVEKVERIAHVLRTTKFNGFPVFPADR